MFLLITVELNLMTLKGPFQPELFYDSMKFKDQRGSPYLYSFAARIGTYTIPTTVLQRLHYKYLGTDIVLFFLKGNSFANKPHVKFLTIIK